MTVEKRFTRRLQDVLGGIKLAGKKPPVVGYVEEEGHRQRGVLEQADDRIEQLSRSSLRTDRHGLSYFDIRLTGEVRRRMSPKLLNDLGVEMDQDPREEIRVKVSFGAGANNRVLYLTEIEGDERIKLYPDESSDSFKYVRQSFRKVDNGSGHWVDVGQANDASDSVGAVLDAGVSRLTRSIRY